MKAIVLLFDSLKRDWIPPYGDAVVAPNFRRLAGRAAAFDNFYVGSLPCMPARRDLHTGRLNFLHRGWAPLEPFDDSVPELLRDAGVHTHLVSDHHHYWRDGGANYHARFSTNEHIRGQEGDPWKGEVGAPAVNTTMAEQLPSFFSRMLAQDGVNRRHMATEATHCQTLVFDAGLEFMEANKGADRWMLQIECFDPHEPFYTFDEYRKLYPGTYEGRHVDWPLPGPADQAPDYVAYVQNQYKALVSMIDRNLGRVLDSMDRNGLWEDTMLVVTADHGLLLGEHDWWSKGAMPTYNEIANIPFLVWDPRCKAAGVRRKALAQNIDLAATLLDFFGLPLPPDMEGRPLAGAIAEDSPVRDCALFGYFGGSVNVTDGRCVYLRGPASPANAPLFEYTLCPARMSGRAEVKELRGLELAPPFPFTKGCPTLKIDAAKHPSPFGNMYRFGSRLYDLEADPGQKAPLDDPATELRMIGRMMDLMRANGAPPEQFARLGLREGMTAEDLAEERRKFAEGFRPPVLPDLAWSRGAANQLSTLVAFVRDPGLAVEFEKHMRDKGAASVDTEDVLGFARAVLPPAQAGAAAMLLRLGGRTD